MPAVSHNPTLIATIDTRLPASYDQVNPEWSRFSMSKLRLPVLFLALALWASAAPAETAPTPPRDLRELLATVDGELTLQVVLASGERVEGHAYRVENDTLQLATDAGMIAREPPPAGRARRRAVGRHHRRRDARHARGAVRSGDFRSW
jgi:hypothetical protein